MCSLCGLRQELARLPVFSELNCAPPTTRKCMCVSYALVPVNVTLFADVVKDLKR